MIGKSCQFFSCSRSVSPAVLNICSGGRSRDVLRCRCFVSTIFESIEPFYIKSAFAIYLLSPQLARMAAVSRLFVCDVVPHFVLVFGFKVIFNFLDFSAVRKPSQHKCVWFVVGVSVSVMCCFFFSNTLKHSMVVTSRHALTIPLCNSSNEPGAVL